MSFIEKKLCEKILNEFFGSIVTQVARMLLKKGCYTLRQICQASNHPKSKVQESLCVLIKHNLVTWDETKIANTEYTLHSNRVLLLLRFPKYIYLIREQYGEEAEMIVDLLLKEGQATISQIIIDSALKLLDANEANSTLPELNNKHITIRNAFEKLVKNQYIQRCPSPQSHNQAVPTLTIKAEDLHRFETNWLDLKLLQEEIQDRCANSDQNLMIQATKTVRCHPDKDIYWRLNYDRFHLEFRDIEMRDCVIRGFDALAGTCFSAMLDVAYRKNDPWIPEFNVILAAEIRDQLKDFANLDQYLTVMVERDGTFIRKVGEAGGGQYVLDVGSFIKTITMSYIDQIVENRYGSNAARIFRLVRETGMMPDDNTHRHIAQLSMISHKEAYPLVHQLLKDNFFRMYEVRKGASQSSGSKSVYLIYMEPSAVVRMVLKWSYKTIYNLMGQRNMIHQQHKRLLERKSRVDMIVERLSQSEGTQEQIQEVEEIFSQSERELVTKVNDLENRILDRETSLDDTVFILQMYLYYESQKS